MVHVRWHPYKPIPAKFPPFELESKGKNAEEPRNRAEWAKAIAGVLFKRSEARSKEVKLANGEALPTGAEKILHDTLTVPDLASVEASFERTRLLIQQGPGVAAMAVDASTSIQAKNTLEKMMVHQLAAVHRAVMDQLAFAPSRPIPRRAHLFSDCIHRNRDPEPSGREGLIDVHIIQALYRSSTQRKPVKLNLPAKSSWPAKQQAIHRPPVRKPQLVHVKSPSL